MTIDGEIDLGVCGGGVIFIGGAYQDLGPSDEENLGTGKLFGGTVLHSAAGGRLGNWERHLKAVY